MDKDKMRAAIQAFRDKTLPASLELFGELSETERTVVQLVLEFLAPPPKKKRSDVGQSRKKATTQGAS